MKPKLLSLFLLISMLLSLVSCTVTLGGDNNGDGGKDDTPKDPYFITYASKGDGTCSATVNINPEYYERMDIVIPDASPDGDTVTSVSFADSFVPIAESFPQIISKESMDALLAQLAANLEDGKNDRVYQRLRGFYVFFDYASDNTAPSIKNSILEDYPFMEYTGSGYVFDEKASAIEINLIASYIHEYTDFSARKLAKDETEKIISVMKAAGVPESDCKYKILEGQRYTDGVSTLCINSIKLPAGLKSIDISSPKNFFLNDLIVPAGSISSVIEALSRADIQNVYSLDAQPPEDFKLPEAEYRLPDGTVIPEEDYVNYSEKDLLKYAIVTPPSVYWYQETRPGSDYDYPAWNYVDGKPLSWKSIR